MQVVKALIISILAAAATYIFALVFLFPAAASPNPLSSPLADFLGFWLGTRAKEDYALDTAFKFLGLHFVSLTMAWIAFSAVRKKLLKSP
jgi:hypothetical protein